MKSGRLTDEEAAEMLSRLGYPIDNPLCYAEEGVSVFSFAIYLGGVCFEQDSLYWMQEAG